MNLAQDLLTTATALNQAYREMLPPAAVKPAPASPPAPTELQSFLTGIDTLSANQTGSRATFLVRDLSALVGISEMDVVDMIRSEADYWLDGKRFSHAGIKSELRRQWLNDRAGEVELEVWRNGEWQLGMAAALGVVEPTALPGCPDWPVERLQHSEVRA